MVSFVFGLFDIGLLVLVSLDFMFLVGLAVFGVYGGCTVCLVWSEIWKKFLFVVFRLCNVWNWELLVFRLLECYVVLVSCLLL